MAKLQGLICLSACPQAREVMDAMQKDAHLSQIPVLKVDGGASNNNLLMQMQADALQVALCSSSHDCFCRHQTTWRCCRSSHSNLSKECNLFDNTIPAHKLRFSAVPNREA